MSEQDDNKSYSHIHEAIFGPQPTTVSGLVRMICTKQEMALNLPKSNKDRDVLFRQVREELFTLSDELKKIEAKDDPDRN